VLVSRTKPPPWGFFASGAGWLHGTKPCTAGYTVATRSPETTKPNLVSWA